MPCTAVLTAIDDSDPGKRVTFFVGMRMELRARILVGAPPPIQTISELFHEEAHHVSFK